MGSPFARFMRIAVAWFKSEYLILSPSDDDNPENPVSVLIVLRISPLFRKENMMYCRTGCSCDMDTIGKNISIFSWNEKTVPDGMSIFSKCEKTVPLTECPSQVKNIKL